MCKRIFITLILGLLALLVLPAMAQAMSYDQAVNKLVKQGWPQAIAKKLCTFKSSSLGFRAGGTPADDAQARYIARQMRAIGLADVHLEGVPVDEWSFKSASVKVGSTVYRASSFGGVAATSLAGVNGQVVYVGGGSAAEFAAAGDVTGKIVLVDFQSPMWWMSYPGMEAGVRGASAVILTHSDNADFFGYYDRPNALGAFDAETDISSPPMVYISWHDGDALKALLGAGAVTATVKNNVDIRMADDGGLGYNVLGSIPGSGNNGEMVLYGSHHDAWFSGGLDNASAVVNSLVAAKAMKMSGYHPKRTIVFLSTTAEEYGYTNSYYDWCIGAWHCITQTHPDWAGKISVMLNSELQGYKEGNLWMLASPETQQAIADTLTASDDLTLTKNDTPAAVIGGPWSWNDQWTFTAEGVPSISFWSQDSDYSGVCKTQIYHTQYDKVSLIDWRFFGDINKFQFRLARKYAGRALLPYDLAARSTDLEGALATQLGATAAGDPADPTVRTVIAGVADATVYGDFMAAKARFDAATAWYAAHSGAISAVNRPSTNANLLQIEKALNQGLTALDWLDTTSYPFDQTTRDIYHLQNAAAALGGTPNFDTAGAEVGSVGLMWYGTNFSHAVFARELQRHRSSYYRICWGGQGKLAEYRDLTPEYNAILAHNVGALAGVNAALAAQVSDLDDRLVAITDILNDAADQISDLVPPVAGGR